MLCVRQEPVDGSDHFVELFFLAKESAREHRRSEAGLHTAAMLYSGTVPVVTAHLRADSEYSTPDFSPAGYTVVAASRCSLSPLCCASYGMRGVRDGSVSSPQVLPPSAADVESLCPPFTLPYAAWRYEKE